MIAKERRYDLDWLRIISILAVYLHHIGMPFNGDEFHIMNATSSKALDNIMVFFEQFRLPLLFLISGTGTVFAFSKRSWLQFIKERSIRLIIPLVFGILIIVPPQTYYEHIASYHSYLDIYRKGQFSTNHLWFIENLFAMSVLLIPLILFLKSSKSKKLIHTIDHISVKKYGMLLWAIPLVIMTILIKKIYPTNSKSIANLSVTFYYGYFFASGMVLNTSDHIWSYLKNYRRFNFVIFLICSSLFYAYYFIPGKYLAPYLSVESRWGFWYMVCALVGWTFVISLLGYAQIWFNKKSRLLKKYNEAIYPFYILHQTVIVILAYYIVQLNIAILLKIILLIISSFPLIILLYRFLIYPFKITRILFGMKKNT